MDICLFLITCILLADFILKIVEKLEIKFVSRKQLVRRVSIHRARNFNQRPFGL